MSNTNITNNAATTTLSLDKDDTTVNCSIAKLLLPPNTLSNNTLSYNNNNNSSREEEKQQLEENIKNGFFSTSCLSCRKQHRSCNKQYPTCYDCLERGQECVYQSPKRKGRKKGSTNQKTIDMGSSSSSDSANKSTDNPSRRTLSPTTVDVNNNQSPLSELSNSSTNQLIRRIYEPYIRKQHHFLNNSIRKRTVDMFFDIIGMGYDIISRPKLEQLAFDYMDENIEEDGLFAKNVGFQVSTTRSSAKAMLFAMQAMCEQRVGNGELSKKSYMEARRQLSQSFDNIDNTYVKIAYGLLSCYMAGEGDDITAHFYLNSLKHALERPVTDNTYLLLETGDISTPERQAKHFKTFMLKQKVCLDHNNPQDLNIWEGFISMYTAKTYENPPLAVQEVIKRQPSPQMLAVIDLIISVLNNSSKLHHYTENQRRSTAIYITIMNNSAKMAVLLSLGIRGGTLLDNLADSITSLTDSDIFLLLPCSAIHYFAISMNYRLMQFSIVQELIKKKLDSGKSLLSIFEEHYEKHYFEMVSKDMKALTRLNTRYKRVEKFYGSLLNHLKGIIQWKSDKTLELQVQNIYTEPVGEGLYNPYKDNNNQETFTSLLGQNPMISTSTYSFDKDASFVNRTIVAAQSEQQTLLDSLDDLLGSSDDFLNFDDFTTK